MCKKQYTETYLMFLACFDLIHCGNLKLYTTQEQNSVYPSSYFTDILSSILYLMRYLRFFCSFGDFVCFFLLLLFGFVLFCSFVLCLFFLVLYLNIHSTFLRHWYASYFVLCYPVPCHTGEACSCLKPNYAWMQTQDAWPIVPQQSMVSHLFLFKL